MLEAEVTRLHFLRCRLSTELSFRIFMGSRLDERFSPSSVILSCFSSNRL